VDTLLLRTQTMGISQLEYYEKTSEVDAKRRTMYILRQMPPHEMAQRLSGDGGLADASPDELREAVEAIESHCPKMERALREEMQKSGLPGGIEVVSNVQCKVPVPDPTAVALTTLGGGVAMPAAPTGQANSLGQGSAYSVDAGAKPDAAGLNAARQACLKEKIAAAARDLGLTEHEIAECQNR
jgi:hypothetical protein